MEECHNVTMNKINAELNEVKENAALKLHQNETQIKNLEKKVWLNPSREKNCLI